jgi:hypothetical protein
MSSFVLEKPKMSITIVGLTQCLIVIIISIIIFFIFTLFTIPDNVGQSNYQKISKHSLSETGSSKIMDLVQNWRTTFDGGSQLLAVRIDSFEIAPYNEKIDSLLKPCSQNNIENYNDYKPSKVYKISFTDIWYFGIPINSNSISCKV